MCVAQSGKLRLNHRKGSAASYKPSSFTWLGHTQNTSFIEVLRQAKCRFRALDYRFVEETASKRETRSMESYPRDIPFFELVATATWVTVPSKDWGVSGSFFDFLRLAVTRFARSLSQWRRFISKAKGKI